MAATGAAPDDTQDATGEEAPSRDSIGGFIEKLTGRITAIGGAFAAVIALNTLISGCSKDNLERHATFRSSVESEEKFWHGLYDQYLATFEPSAEGADKAADDARREAKRRAIQALTNHAIPDFREHQLGLLWRSTTAQDQASRNIAAIKTGLVDALTRSDSPKIAQSTQEAIFQSDEAGIARAAKPAEAASRETPVPMVEQSVRTDTIISYQSQTLARGAAKGWDIDVFWCAGPDESIRYGKAGAIATLLADAANAKGSKLPQQDLLLGRVRLRSLPVGLQGRGYPSTGREIMADANGSETVVARRLGSFLNATQTPAFTVRTRGRGSAWYLSVFVCG